MFLVRRRGRDARRRALARDAERADGRTALALGAPGGRRRPARWRCCSPRAARTTSPAPRSGRCCSSASARSRSSTRRAAPRSGPSALYVAVLVAAFAIPNSLGQNALRPGVVLGPALLVLFARPRAPRAAIVGDRRRAALPAVAAGRARGRGGARRPVDRGRVPRRGAALPRRRAPQPGERLEVPLTRNHWEATYLARGLPARPRLAPAARPQGQPALLRPRAPAHRGRATSAGCATTPCAGSRCRPRRSTSPRGSSAACCSADLPFLEPVHASAQLAHLGGARPRAARRPAPARLTAAGADGFDLEATRPGAGARAPARDAVLDGRRRRRLRVGGPRLGLDARRRRAARAWSACARASPPPARCAASRAAPTTDPGDPLPHECGQPPCRPDGERGLALGAPMRTLPTRFAARFLPKGWRDLAAPDPAVLRRLLALPAGARPHRRPGRGGVRQRARADPARAGPRPVRRAGGARLGGGHVVAHRRRELDVRQLALHDHDGHARVHLPAAQPELLLHPQHVHGRDGDRARALRRVPDRAAALHARVGLPGLRRAVHRADRRRARRPTRSTTRSPPCRRCTSRSR